MELRECDLLVIGGGINGLGVAVDAAGRGLSVIVCEKDDLANHTSSASTKLIHGGLRYLEQIEFKLVQEGLREREILLHKAPHLVHPLTFVLPHDRHLRKAWMIRIGLFLYDTLAQRASLSASKKLKLQKSVEGQALKPQFTVGFSYTDCQTDDARLVIANALAAKELGVDILTRTTVDSIKRENGWSIEAYNRISNRRYHIRAKAIVNATGAWVSDILKNIVHAEVKSGIRLIKGSHFTVPKLYEGNFAYILQNFDDRVIFAIPYENDFTLIGTTDIAFHDNPNQVDISEDEINYLCGVINYYFKKSITKEMINWTYSGVRALYDSGEDKPQKITRDYHLELEDQQGQFPILSVFGGKLTTYRSLAEHVMKKLAPYFPKIGKPWTATSQLPGGDLGNKSLLEFIGDVQQQYPWLPLQQLQRYAHTYGTKLHQLLAGAHSLSDLGQDFGHTLFEKEVKYLVAHEWAITSDDILWRRSKLGLFFSKDEVAKLEEYLTHV